MNERIVKRVEVENLTPSSWKTLAENCPREVRENYELVDDCIFEAYQEQIWPDNLEKAPNMWESDDEVPEFVKEFVEFVLENTNVLYENFDGIPHSAARKIQDILEEKLTQSQGWSIRSVKSDLEDEFPGMPESQAETIARTEIGAVLNESREVAYESREYEDEEFEYYWSGPSDSRETIICEEIKEEVNDRGGAVPMDDLKKILENKSKKYEDIGGTPRRVKDWVPHYQCRHSFVRKV